MVLAARMDVNLFDEVKADTKALMSEETTL